jgi:hypothetical protein
MKNELAPVFFRLRPTKRRRCTRRHGNVRHQHEQSSEGAVFQRELHVEHFKHQQLERLDPAIATSGRDATGRKLLAPRPEPTSPERGERSRPGRRCGWRRHRRERLTRNPSQRIIGNRAGLPIRRKGLHQARRSVFCGHLKSNSSAVLRGLRVAGTSVIRLAPRVIVLKKPLLRGDLRRQKAIDGKREFTHDSRPFTFH